IAAPTRRARSGHSPKPARVTVTVSRATSTAATSPSANRASASGEPLAWTADAKKSAPRSSSGRSRVKRQRCASSGSALMLISGSIVTGSPTTWKPTRATFARPARPPYHAGASVPAQEQPASRLPRHPGPLRCSSSRYPLDTTSSSRLVGRARRQPWWSSYSWDGTLDRAGSRRLLRTEPALDRLRSAEPRLGEARHPVAARGRRLGAGGGLRHPPGGGQRHGAHAPEGDARILLRPRRGGDPVGHLAVQSVHARVGMDPGMAEGRRVEGSEVR